MKPPTYYENHPSGRHSIRADAHPSGVSITIWNSATGQGIYVELTPDNWDRFVKEGNSMLVQGGHRDDKPV